MNDFKLRLIDLAQDIEDEQRAREAKRLSVEQKRTPVQGSNRNKAIVCVETGGLWSSIRELAEALGRFPSGVGYSILHGCPISGLTYRPQGDPDWKPLKRKCRSIKSVRCLETGEIWKTLSHAARMMKRDRKTIQRAIDQKAVLDGHHFEVFEPF